MTLIYETSISLNKKKRCSFCNKKIGLTEFNCRCDGCFCQKHRVPEVHNCTFNYSAEAEITISKNNPTIIGKKIEVI